MPTREEYGATLKRLRGLLRRQRLTVAEIAEAMKCSKPVAYARLKDLSGDGSDVQSYPRAEFPEGSRARGPRPLVYFVP